MASQLSPVKIYMYMIRCYYAEPIGFSPTFFLVQYNADAHNMHAHLPYILDSTRKQEPTKKQVGKSNQKHPLLLASGINSTKGCEMQ